MCFQSSGTVNTESSRKTLSPLRCVGNTTTFANEKTTSRRKHYLESKGIQLLFDEHKQTPEKRVQRKKAITNAMSMCVRRNVKFTIRTKSKYGECVGCDGTIKNKSLLPVSLLMMVCSVSLLIMIICTDKNGWILYAKKRQNVQTNTWSKRMNGALYYEISEFKVISFIIYSPRLQSAPALICHLIVAEVFKITCWKSIQKSTIYYFISLYIRLQWNQKKTLLEFWAFLYPT